MPVRMVSFRGKKNKLYRPRTIWSLLSSLLSPFPVKSLPCRLTASVLQAEYSSFFSAHFRLKVCLYYSWIIARDISFLEYIYIYIYIYILGVSIIVSFVSFFVKRFERNTLKTYNCIVLTDFQHTKLHPFQIFSLGFILKISFSRFRRFQPRYCMKYLLIKKSVFGQHTPFVSAFSSGQSL